MIIGSNDTAAFYVFVKVAAEREVAPTSRSSEKPVRLCVVVESFVRPTTPRYKSLPRLTLGQLGRSDSTRISRFKGHPLRGRVLMNTSTQESGTHRETSGLIYVNSPRRVRDGPAGGGREEGRRKKEEGSIHANAIRSTRCGRLAPFRCPEKT
jgi:hypothetical protein